MIFAAAALVLLLAAEPVASPSPTPDPMAGMDMSEHAHHHHMDMTGALGLPITREASGTAWQPDTTPHAATHFMAGPWTLMLHGIVFAGFDHQEGARGDDSFASVNWLMLMARRKIASGDFGARIMLSAEPATVPAGGYPLLLQSGETYHGRALHDVQHPHDLFMELAAMYTHEIGPLAALQLYLAPSGEPALGPVAFPHRASAMSDPFAPLGHHWQDSTHVSFGVATLGLITRHAKLEASAFNGREPDANRWDFDFRAIDSWSGRLTIMPIPSLAMQASYGFLKSPEQLEPDRSQDRMTASATYDRRLGAGNWATTAVWGRVHPRGEKSTTSALLETNLDLDGRNTIFGRIEDVQKTGADLALPSPLDAQLFELNSFSAGYVRDAGPFAGWNAGIGAVVTESFLPSSLEDAYGLTNPVGAMLYLRLRPAAQEHM